MISFKLLYDFIIQVSEDFSEPSKMLILELAKSFLILLYPLRVGYCGDIE